ncbi:MAG: polyphenol oxidase family protein, partial [Candidatus Binataceae bacterium]
ARVIGALHAGWRGIVAGIADAGVAAMTQLGAQPGRIRVAMGPSIRQCCFEVDAVLADRFEREIPQARQHRRDGRAAKAMLDLCGIAREQFVAAGVPPDSIALAGECTKCACERYFSRRAAGGATTGLQLSFIGINS